MHAPIYAQPPLCRGRIDPLLSLLSAIPNWLLREPPAVAHRKLLGGGCLRLWLFCRRCWRWRLLNTNHATPTPPALTLFSHTRPVQVLEALATVE